jgi:hypothetical protein
LTNREIAAALHDGHKQLGVSPWQPVTPQASSSSCPPDPRSASACGRSPAPARSSTTATTTLTWRRSQTCPPPAPSCERFEARGGVLCAAMWIIHVVF